MIYAKITELKDRYMIYNSVKNERKWEEKKMELDEEELKATRELKRKKCEFCDKHKRMYKQGFEIQMFRNRLQVGNECSEGCGWQATMFDINYCLICGRRLV